MSVHFSPFVRQMQFDSLHERLHSQARRVSPALSAGDPSIQPIVSCCSSSFHPFLQDPVFPDHLSGSFSRLQLDSWHGWYAFWDSLEMEVADVILHHLSLHRTNGTAMHQSWSRPVLWHTTCIRTPPTSHANLGNSTVGLLQAVQMLPWIQAFAFNIVSARILHFSANALTVSQPVKACIPSNALHTSGPTDAATFEISMKRVRVWVPHFWNSEACMLSLNVRQMMKTYVSSAQITTDSNPYLDAWAAWSSTRPCASSCWIDVAGTSWQHPWVIFQHLSICVTYRHFRSNLSVYCCFFHTFSRNCIQLALL